MSPTFQASLNITKCKSNINAIKANYRNNTWYWDSKRLKSRKLCILVLFFQFCYFTVYLVTFHSSLLCKFHLSDFKTINVFLCSFLLCSFSCFLCSWLSLTLKRILVASIRPAYILQHGFGDVHCSHATTCFDCILYRSLGHQWIFLQILREAVTVYWETTFYGCVPVWQNQD